MPQRQLEFIRQYSETEWFIKFCEEQIIEMMFCVPTRQQLETVKFKNPANKEIIKIYQKHITEMKRYQIELRKNHFGH